MTIIMNEVIGLILVLLAGILLGILFFGGLWFTVRRGLNSKMPALVFSGSLIIRATLVLLGFYYAGANDWKRILVCLIGFLIARTVIKRLTNTDNQVTDILKKEVSNET